MGIQNIVHNEEKEQEIQHILETFSMWAGRPLKRQEENIILKAIGNGKTLDLFTKLIHSIYPPKVQAAPDQNQTVIEDYLVTK
ncbi:hypothetical protein ACHHV8_36515 [Paenibacillus sp. TAB 01]|uniref:hypothetical protein n=1 Tax=Paenibacillus sp. TAB 01 TaxID=3368988 RepID=UPI0037537616